jgi:hypothetical protein
MTELDANKYGYPLRDGYGITTDLALLNTEVQSGWTRQRRTFLHNASLITLSWRLRMPLAKELREWLMEQADDQFFDCTLMTGNDELAPCALATLPIRRTTGIRETRVPMTDQVVLTFSAETQEQVGYQALATAARGLPPQTYPADFPLPKATGFESEHGARNRTVYTLSYALSQAQLAEWLAFVGFQGTAWFFHPMISTNVLCGSELIRYISPPVQTLVAPAMWSVSITAETQPGYSMLSIPDAPVVGDCFYNSDIEYNDATESYDCDGGTPPPQGEFTMPVGLLTVADAQVGSSPLSGAAVLRFKTDGTVVSSPASSPAWPTWHTAPQTLPQPAVSFNQVVEVSRDGTNWVFYTPLPGGTWLSLKTQDVWIRLAKTSTYDIAETLDLIATFEADQIPTPAQFSTATIRLSVTLDVTDPTGVVDGAAFSDGYLYTIDPGDTVESVSAGVTFLNDGRVFGQSGNQFLGLWFDPQQINAGQGLWIILAGTGAGTGQPGGKSFPPTGVRLSLAVTNPFTASAGASGGGSFASVNWNGTYQIYNSQVGGTLLGSGTIDLNSEVSQ